VKCRQLEDKRTSPRHRESDVHDPKLPSRSPGSSLLVLGAAGGVGLTAVEIGKPIGARVIAAASTPEKLRVAADRGADALINYSSEKLTDRVMAPTARARTCASIPWAASFSTPPCRRWEWGGRILIIGFVAGVPSIPAKSVARQEPLGARQRVTLFPLARARQAPALRRLL
jgi:NADPH:quinone reductase-like Zn-dependent oxidoreductase